jgi:N-acetyl sugar amidotransferase
MTYKICVNCVMDTSDPDIMFDNKGKCDYCLNFYKNILPEWKMGNNHFKKISRMVDNIKKNTKGKKHNCLLGISGGVDSSYLAYLAKEVFGLNPLIFHVDAGWNTDVAVSNIERIVDALDLDLHTEVVNWSEMRDLQLSFFKAGVPHLDTPQDHAFQAALYNFAAKNNFKFILNGGNFSTECIREPIKWHYHASDLTQLLDIHRRFGNVKLRSFPLAGIFKYKLYYRYVKGIRVYRPLNYVSYIKSEAMTLLINNFGWKPYSHKHYESRFTKFYEGYWLPNRFGFDKRRAHFSSLILTGQMLREDAIKQLSKGTYSEDDVENDLNYISNKLNISRGDLNDYYKSDKKYFYNYKNNVYLIQLGVKLLKFLGIQRSIIR